MKPLLFIDTWGWLTLHDRDELRHDEVKTFVEDFFSSGGQAVTTDYVLDETINLLSRRLYVEKALETYAVIQEAESSGVLIIDWITPERFERTMDLRARYDDKPGISCTDLSSMVVMQERGLRDVLTGDAHFQHVGLGFQCHP